MHKIISKLPNSFYQANVKNYKVGAQMSITSHYVIKIISVSLVPHIKDVIVCHLHHV